jgi:hypothetical protein
MVESVLQRIPVVGGLGYVERVQQVPSQFTATLQVEPDNRYFPHAIAVVVNGAKVGYVAPEVARRYYDAVAAHAGQPLTCGGRRGAPSDHETSGVELLLDFSNLPVGPGE